MSQNKLKRSHECGFWLAMNPLKRTVVVVVEQLSLQQCANKTGFDDMASISTANADGFFGISFGFKEAKAKANFR